MLNFLLQVRPPKVSRVDESKNKLDALLDSGNVTKAMQIAFSLLSVAGEANDTQIDSVSNNSTLRFLLVRRHLSGVRGMIGKREEDRLFSLFLLTINPRVFRFKTTETSEDEPVSALKPSIGIGMIRLIE